MIRKKHSTFISIKMLDDENLSLEAKGFICRWVSLEANGLRKGTSLREYFKHHEGKYIMQESEDECVDIVKELIEQKYAKYDDIGDLYVYDEKI